MKNFSIGDVISRGWRLTKENLSLVLRLTIIGFVLSIISNYLNNQGAHAIFPDKLVFVFSAIGISIISILVHIGFVKIGLEIIDGAKPKISQLLSYSNYFWRFLGGSILYTALVALTFIISLAIVLLMALLFHSTLILAMAILSAFISAVVAMYFFFTLPLIIDLNLGPIEAMKRSAEMTDGIRLDLFGFVVIIILLNILGAICMLVGLLLTVPITFFAYLLIYRQVLKSYSFK